MAVALPPIYAACMAGDAAHVAALIAGGADVHATDHPLKQTPLFHAATPEVVQLRLAAGASPLVLDVHGCLPLVSHH